MRIGLFILLLTTAGSLSLAATEQAPARSSLELPTQITVKTYMGLVEEYLTGVLRNEKLIALTNEAKSKNWETVKPLLMQLSKDLSTKATVWYAMPDGSYYATEAGGLTKQNIKDREYFPRLMEGQDVLGDLVISKSIGLRSVIVASPVVVNKKTIAAVGVSISLPLLSSLVEARTQLPANTYFYALNSNAKIAIHRYADRMFKQVRDVGDEALQDQFKEVMKKDHGTFEYVLNGKKVISVFEKSPKLGWYFFFAQEQPARP